MLQPKVWVIKEKKVIDVHAIDFVNKIIFQNTGGIAKKFYPFDEVEFMENTGFKDNNGKYIYVGDIVTLDEEEPPNRYKVIKNKDELMFYLEPIAFYSVTNKLIPLRKPLKYHIRIIAEDYSGLKTTNVWSI